MCGRATPHYRLLSRVVYGSLMVIRLSSLTCMSCSSVTLVVESLLRSDVLRECSQNLAMSLLVEMLKPQKDSGGLWQAILRRIRRLLPPWRSLPPGPTDKSASAIR